jgi:hypothetical protein
MLVPFFKIGDDRFKNDLLTAGFHAASFPQVHAIASGNGLSVREA